METEAGRQTGDAKITEKPYVLKKLRISAHPWIALSVLIFLCVSVPLW